MEGKVVIITLQPVDPLVKRFLADAGFPWKNIEIYTFVNEALAVPDLSAQLVLFQLSSGDTGMTIDALCAHFSEAPVILLAEQYNERLALELLQYGAQDYILNNNYTSLEFKRTIDRAIRRKQFSLKQNNEMQTQKRRLDHILSSINEVVWSCTADSFETIYINDACYDIYGYKPDEIIGNCDLLFGCVHQEDKKHYKTGWRQLLKHGKSVFEYRIIHKDGTLRYIKNEAVLRRDQNNIPRFINGFARDVTLQKMQFLKIQKQNEQLQEIAWIQSHKVRGPVASILGLAQLFSTDTADADNIQVIRHLQTAAGNLDLVIRDIVSKSYS